MNHYEELGLDRRASTEEIRLAYKRLAKLLHPDQCHDESTRGLAEIQMKRLNRLLAVLTDARERQAYDRRLRPQPEPRRAAWTLPVRRTPQWLWPVLGAAALVALLVVLTHAPKPAPPFVAAALPAAAPQEPPKQQPHRSRKERRGAPTGKRAQAATPPDQPQEAAPPRESESPREDQTPATASAEPPPTAPRGEAAETPANPTLAGEWLFVPSPNTRTNGLYPPEYIELLLTEDSGTVRGHYRARYRVNDRAISPTVAFEFEGRTAAEPTRLAWQGAGGAKGDVTLRLLTDGRLEVTWMAHQIGNELGLVSGTATLVRKQD